jgi:putative aldouronate transport system substrate-binding protein
MFRKVKKLIVLSLAGVMATVALSGCGGVSTGSSPAVQGGEGKEVELTIFYMENQAFNDNYPVFKKAAEMTGVSLRGIVPKSASDWKQTFGVMMASGERADITCVSSETINEYGIQGAFEPLNGLIDEYAPNIKAFLESHPNVKRAITAVDGNIYQIPMVHEGEVQFGWFIRKDWLDKFGLSIPKTVDEYYNALKTFVDNDANGNGKRDEAPFFNRNAGAGWGQAIADFYVFWDASNEWFVKDGKVYYGPCQPEFKTANVNVAKWYKEGLIDVEIFTRGSKARDILLAENLGGSTHDWFTSTAAYNDSLKERIPGFEFIPFAPPGGVETSTRSEVSGKGWAMSSENRYKEETMRYFDFWFGEEGRRLINFGIEGEHYDMADGKPIFKESLVKGDKNVLTVLNEAGAQISIGFWQDISYEEQLMNDISKKGMKEYIDNKYCKEPFPKLNLTEQEKKRFREIMGVVNTFRDESVQSWILGSSDTASSFSSYISRIFQMGIEEATQIQQAAYDRYINIESN